MSQSHYLNKPPECDELFYSTFYQAAVGIVHVDMATARFLRANKTICDMLGYTEAEFCSKTIPEVTHPDDVQADLENTQKMITGEISTFSIEKRLLKKDGTPVWTRLTAISVARDEHGVAKYGMAFCEDISEIKRSEQALQESEERFRILADSAPVSIFLTDTEPKTIYVNKSWLDYTGLRYEESLNLDWQSVIHPDDTQNYLATFYQAFRRRESFRFEARVRRASGDYGWFLATGVPRYTPSGEFLGYIGTGTDISERKEMEESLERAKAEAEEASRKKSEFLSLMSHELRTPLNAIIGFSKMLEEGIAGKLNNEQQEFISYVSAGGRHLLNLVNDLLDMAKIEAGKMRIKVECIEAAAVIGEVQTMISELANQKEVTLHFRIGPGLKTIHADPGRFKQILINLVNNAIKFNNRGGEVKVNFERSPDEKWIVVTVADTGIGIPESKLPELFSRFYQVDHQTTRKYEGTGLGLALSKDLIEMHGGDISVESMEGVGTTFTVRLPILET